jgi:outer membrane protein assembly factor BamB
MGHEIRCRTRKGLSRCRLILLAFSLIYSAAMASAQVTIPAAAWPMFHHDPAHTGLSQFSTATNNGSLKWTHRISGYADSSPIVGIGGMIYITGDSLYAIAPDGTTKWTYPIVGGDPEFDYATTTAAQGRDGTIYFGAYTGDFYAVDSSGALRWLLPMNGLIFDTDATVSSDTIYVGSDLYTGGGSLYALNPDSTIKWTFYLGEDVYSNPAVKKGIVSIPSVGTLAGFYKLNASSGLLVHRGAPLKNLASFRFAPAATDDRTFYQVDLRGYLAKFTREGPAWLIPIAPKARYIDFWSSPAIGPDGTVYIGSMDDKLYSVSPTGSINWTVIMGAPIYSSPAVSADGTIYVGSGDAHLYAVNPDGSIKWSFSADDSISSSPAIGGDGTIYFASDNGILYALD